MTVLYFSDKYFEKIPLVTVGRIDKKAHHIGSRVHQEVIIVVLHGHRVSPAWALGAG